MHEGDVSKEILISVLRANGVDVSNQEDTGMTVFAKGDVIEVVNLDPFVRRKMVHWFQRKFNVPIHLFYNPLMIMPPTKESS
jgi:hypothetical protein